MKIYDITPIGKPRMTRADKWKKRPAVMRYRAFCDEARLRKINLRRVRRARHLRYANAPELEQKEARTIQRQAAPVKTRLRQHA